MVVKGHIWAIVATVALGAGFVAACGSDDKNEDEDTSTGDSLSFTSDVNPILTNSCGASGCHGATPASGRKTYVGNEANFKADKALVLSQLSSNAMPESQGGTISAANEKILVDFLNQ